jgi:hypothetical protein
MPPTLRHRANRCPILSVGRIRDPFTLHNGSSGTYLPVKGMLTWLL